MPATRRELLSDIVKGAAAAAIYPLVPRVAFAQDADGDLTRRIAADLARHAAFGDKFSGGPGDVATAQWIAGRHRWFHTTEDTLARVDAGLVTPVVRAHQRAIELLVEPA